jgi:hypothetical protein
VAPIETRKHDAAWPHLFDLYNLYTDLIDFIDTPVTHLALLYKVTAHPNFDIYQTNSQECHELFVEAGTHPILRMARAP